MKSIKGAVFASLGMTLIFLVCGAIVGMLSLIPIIAQDSAEAITVGFIMLAISIILILMGISNHFRTKRFMRYITLICAHNITSIEQIAANTKHQSINLAKKDLQNMISWGYFENTIINEETNEIVIGDQDTSEESADSL